jgi:hypothetical protein
MLVPAILVACNATSAGDPIVTGPDSGTEGSDGTAGESGSTDDGSGDDGNDDGPVDCEATTCESWCDPQTWGGTVPTADTDVVVPDGKVVLVDCDAEAKTLTIEPGAAVVASRTTSATLTMHGNLVVTGRLDYGTPEDRIRAGVVAQIVFTGMSDADFVGTPSTVFGGDEFGPSADTELSVIDSDVGLWVIDSGRVTAAGEPKKAWSFLTESAGPGDAELTVEDAAGWQVGDMVALTPTAARSEDEHYAQFDEAAIASVSGNTIGLDAAPAFAHAGCTDCMRRGEVANLTRNVVIRSADDTAHAHVMVAHRATLQLDSVELRWLGPEWPEPVCGGPDRRAAVYFHQLDDRSLDSYVRHTAIWGGDSGVVWVERTDGVEILDVVGYDTIGSGFRLFYDTSACGTRCTDRDVAPADIVITDSMAAKVGVARRSEGCARIQHRHAAFVVSGDEGSGCVGCVATGNAHIGSGSDAAGFSWAEGGSGRPEAFVFSGNVAHNNNSHGSFIWHNGSNEEPAYEDNAFWSNEGFGLRFGAYGNAYRFVGFTALDNGEPSVGLKSVPNVDGVRMSGLSIDAVHIQDYVNVQQHIQHLLDVEFSGNVSPAVTQFAATCMGGDENDPEDPTCARVMLLLENVTFPGGIVPFDFGDPPNFHTVWEIRGFAHPDYTELPADFDLYRIDNEVAGGSAHTEFNAWLVPR